MYMAAPRNIAQCISDPPAMESLTPSDGSKNTYLKHLLDYLQNHPATSNKVVGIVASDLGKLATFWARTTLSNLDNVIDKVSIINQLVSAVELSEYQSLAEGFQIFLEKVQDLGLQENVTIDPEFCSIYAAFAIETLGRLEESSKLETVFSPQICITAQGGTWTYTNNYTVETKRFDNGLPVIQYNSICENANKLLVKAYADLYLSYIQVLEAGEICTRTRKNKFETVRDHMKNLVGQSSKGLYERIYDEVVDLIEVIIENNNIESMDSIHEARSCTLNFPLGNGTVLVISFNIRDPLNIAIMGQSGVGKSSFINGLLGLHEDDEGAAQVDTIECTEKVRMYRHPEYKGILFWDLPGVGTKKFPKDTYLTRQDIKLGLYDACFILWCERFTELDGWLAKNIQDRRKPICFVRTKVSESLKADKRKRDFSEEKSLEKIREYCMTQLKMMTTLGREDQLFLVDNWEVEKYDFIKLKNTLKSILRDQVVGNFLRAHGKLKNIEKDLKPLLEETADYLEKLRKDCDIARVSGYTLNIAGGILSIVGGALTLATAGAASPVLIAGISLTASGGAVGFGNSIAKGKLSADSVKRTQAKLTEYKRIVYHVERCISQLKMFGYDTVEDENATKLHGYGYDISSYCSSLGLTASGASLGMRGGLRLADGGLEIGVKAAARATIVLSSLFLVWDTVNLGRGIRDIIQNKECDIAQQLRNMAKGLVLDTQNSEKAELASLGQTEMTQIKKLLECPVCLNEMIPPIRIFQCTNGHGLCQACKEGMEQSEMRRRTCPTCNARIMGRANAMEQVARSLHQM